MNKMRALPFAVLLLLVGLSLPAAHAQSFNCRYARSADEVLICQDAHLARLDEELATVYARLRRQMPEAEQAALARDEHEWLRQRHDCGRDARCIGQLYRERIQALSVRTALPQTVGACVVTTIAKISDRFGGPIGETARADSMGSAVSYTNGGYQVSYDWEAALARSRPGDQVRMCLTSIPKDCPPGDDRGRIYTTTNLRTGEAWTLPDSQHSCGGA